MISSESEPYVPKDKDSVPFNVKLEALRYFVEMFL